LCVKYLHRLPSEVAVLPIAYAELAALEELENPHICGECRREMLTDNLMVRCDACGASFQDPDIKRQLNSK